MSNDVESYVPSYLKPYCKKCRMYAPKIDVLYASDGSRVINVQCENIELCDNLYDLMTDVAEDDGRDRE